MNMAIETAGQQKYADLTAKRIKSLQTGMIIWISLFCLALICSFSNNLLANIVGIVAVVYAVVNTKGRKAFNSKLDKIEDKNEFYRQIVAPDVLELKEEQLLVAKDYVIVVDADVWIYDLHHMEKVFAWGNHHSIPDPPAPPERNGINRIPAQLLDELRKNIQVMHLHHGDPL